MSPDSGDLGENETGYAIETYSGSGIAIEVFADDWQQPELPWDDFDDDDLEDGRGLN